MIDGIGTSSAAGTPAEATRTGGSLGKDAFLTMLVTQMRNQDPLSPMKGEEMAAQLAQFSSLEQLTNISAALEAQGAAQAATIQTLNGSAAVGMLGKTVVAVGDQVEVSGKSGEGVMVDVGQNGGTAVLRLYDASGREVGSRDVGPVAAGRQQIELGAAAEGLPAGAYRYEIEVVDGAGAEVPVQTFVRARVDGVRYDENGAALTAGAVTIRFGSIVEISSGE